VFGIDEELSTPIAGDFDVIVAGGGPAGFAAAVGAAEHGAKVLLIEQGGCLGGVWTSGQLAWVFDINTGGLGGRLMDRLHAESSVVPALGEGMMNFTYDIEAMKWVLEGWCQDLNITILLHARLVAAHLHGKRIHSVITESKSGRQGWSASIFIDCTGDGDLGFVAGNASDTGGANSDEIQPMTLMGLIAVEALAPVSRYISFFQGDYNHLEASARFQKLLVDAGVETSYAHPTLFQIKRNILALMINHEYQIDPSDVRAVTDATIRARREIYRVSRALGNSSSPFRGCHLVSTADHIGVREGRRLKGRATVSLDDLLAGRKQPEAVARIRFNIDIHSSDPKKGKGLETVKVPAYDIPLGALIARDVDGLMMAGRCISGDRKAFSSYRITGGAVAMGEAAGIVGALASREDCLPHELDWSLVAKELPPLE